MQRTEAYVNGYTDGYHALGWHPPKGKLNRGYYEKGYASGATRPTARTKKERAACGCNERSVS